MKKLTKRDGTPVQLYGRDVYIDAADNDLVHAAAESLDELRHHGGHRIMPRFKWTPAVLVSREVDEFGNPTGTYFDVETFDGSGSSLTAKLSWDEMVGQLLSIFPPPRPMLFDPNVRADVAKQQDKLGLLPPSDASER